tara:strand:+ start:1093 stop:1446 length:354 start_codon:yes stop_codon:yes gene_type:complete
MIKDISCGADTEISDDKNKDFDMSERKINPGGQSGQNGNLWMRGLMMLIFIFCLWVARFVLLTVALFQFLNLLLTSNTNQNLLDFGLSLSVYQCQIMRFLTFNTEKQPYPIGDWPSS